MLCAYASRPHYWRHVRAVLPDVDVAVYGARFADPWSAGRRLAARPPEHAHDLHVVASLDDARKAGPAPLVYVEHGAGQTYLGGARPHPSYAGGRDAALGRAELVLVPGESSVVRWRHAYPGVDVRAVGCPKLVPWQHATAPASTVAVTWHWDCPLVPETRTAFWSFRPTLGLLVDRLRAAGVRVVGHAHPRAPDAVWAEWGRLGVDVVADEADVFDQAGVLMADNTSLLYEFAALDRPVVALNAPTYRRDVDHGLRFWSHVPGPQADRWDDAADMALRYVEDPAADRELRARVTAAVYAVDPSTGAELARSAVATLAAAWAP